MNSKSHPTPFEDNGRVVVIGGGPAGSFFAISFLRSIEKTGRKASLTIIEKKNPEPRADDASFFSCREGCNYCAGGISPMLADALEREDLVLPDEVIAGRIRSLTVHGDWKSVELRFPESRKMYAVFRGSRPKTRLDQYRNFDSFLLGAAGRAGADIVTGEVDDVRYAESGKPVVFYQSFENGRALRSMIEADFVVFAGGVNQSLGSFGAVKPLSHVLRNLIPGFSPPRVRKALIGEIEIQKDAGALLEGEIHFVEYGSQALKIEMSSLIPKGNYITVVMLGRAVDEMDLARKKPLLEAYLALPQIRRILPTGTVTRLACICHPRMAVGHARHPLGERVAVIGDMVWSRLYKDGIYSAYLTASALSRAILDEGVGRDALALSYGREIRRLSRDNAFGRFVFMLNRVVFANPALSRILYQAVLTERKTKLKRSRRLADILWKIASGDDTYRASLAAMFHPLTVSSIVGGGLLVTLRNYLTERFFGLRWHNLGRFPTGLHKEDMEEKRKEFVAAAERREGLQRPNFESMYSLVIKAEKTRIWNHLGTFGDEDRDYFRPRFLKVQRISGEANEPGCIIRYQTPFKFLNFRLKLEKRIASDILVYRVEDGFAEGGLLLFRIEEFKPGVHQLSIYVAFDVAKGRTWSEKFFWTVFRRAFPGFVHDVLWNHSLCKMKDTIEKNPAWPDRVPRAERLSRPAGAAGTAD